MITEEEFVALARQKHQALMNLEKETNFYDYEKTFDQIWQDLGKQVLQKNLSDLPNDRRKKKV